MTGARLVLLEPSALWLLLVLPVFLLLRRRSRRELGRGREAAVLVLRLLVALACILALAEPTLRRPSREVATYFLLDRSGSIPEELRAASLAQVREAAAEREHKEDQVGLIVFAATPQIEESPTRHFLPAERVHAVVEESASDLAAAIRLALSTLPEDARKRIVLFSDGRETRGDARGEAARAGAAEVPIDVWPLRAVSGQEVLVESVTAPTRARRGEPVAVRVGVRSTGASRARVRLFVDGSLAGDEAVELAARDNVFTSTQRLSEPGFHLIEAEVLPEKDDIPQNNRAQAYVMVEDEPLALLVGASEGEVEHVARALAEEGVAHRVRRADALPRDPGEWAGFDLLVLANVGAESFSPEQMQLVESLVRDVGMGLVMIGGEKSFGAGAWRNTPIARALPVDLDIREDQVLPSGAVVFVLDHIPCIGDRWTKDIVIGTLRAMNDGDQLGEIHGTRPEWGVRLGPTSDRARIEAAVNALRLPMIGPVGPHMAEAIEALERSRSAVRHVVLVSNGQRNALPGPLVIERMREARITMSIVIIEPGYHHQLDDFERAAAATGGNFYVVQPSEYARVPHIWMQEAARVRRGLYFEESFAPTVAQPSEILAGISQADLPPLHGYNVTSRKDPTEVPIVSNHGDVVLAHWHYGLGKTVAFTSDATGRWGRDWIGWGKFRRFWAQTVAWAERRLPASPYSLTLERGEDGQSAYAIVDAVDGDGRFVNGLKLAGTLTAPGFASSRLVFDQVGPGRYRASFPAGEPGGYVVSIRYEEAGASFLLRGGYVPPYNPEYREVGPDEPLLTAIAGASGGRLLSPGMDFFETPAATAWKSQPLWPFCLALAAVLFPLEVVLRRLAIGLGDLVAPLRRVLGGVIPANPVVEALAAARAQASVRAEASFAPRTAALAGVSAETAELGPSAPEDAESGLELTRRLGEAKERARRKLEDGG